MLSMVTSVVPMSTRFSAGWPFAALTASSMARRPIRSGYCAISLRIVEGGRVC
jgi:hypothetical protein